MLATGSFLPEKGKLGVVGHHHQRHGSPTTTSVSHTPCTGLARRDECNPSLSKPLDDLVLYA